MSHDSIQYDSLSELGKLKVEDLEAKTSQWIPGPDEPPIGEMEFQLIDQHVRQRIRKVQELLEERLVNRTLMIEATLASLISGVPLVIFGPPGTAKSACVQLIAEACAPGCSESTDRKISKACFEYLITSHTMPEELFGPPDLQELQKGAFKRRTAGMLPEAEFAFLDEVFRGGGHILNTLLAMINERRFHNGPSVMKTPLLGVVAAGNAPPSDPETAAFFDRFPIRLWITSILDPTEENVNETASDLLSKSLGHERQRLKLAADGQTAEHLCCTNDFRLANRRLAADHYGLPPEGDMNQRLEEFMTAILRLRERHQISDRSIGSLWRFGAALDWIREQSWKNPFNGADRNTSQGHLDVLTMIGATESDARHCRNLIQNQKSGLCQTSAS